MENRRTCQESNRISSLHKNAEELYSAAVSLKNDALGVLQMGGEELIKVIGFTNYCCLKRRALEMADVIIKIESERDGA